MNDSTKPIRSVPNVPDPPPTGGREDPGCLPTVPSESANAEGEPSDAAGSLHFSPSRAYVVDREIARGGMGRILAARDDRLERTVAIKELLHHRSTARFMREAILTARLEHPSIVPVYDAGTSEDGTPFYTMKLVSGHTLSDAIAQARSLPERLALLPHVTAVAEAIAYAHANGVIHRDIKPSNVIIGAFGETLVVDWGLAKDLRSHELPEPKTAADHASRGGDVTALGEVLGTPAYMAPEQADGKPADARSDVYSLGALLYKLLSGVFPRAPLRESEPPSPAIAPGDLGSGPAVPLEARRLPLPPDLVAIVHKAMATEPRLRYASAGDLAADLKRFTTGQLVGAHRYGLWDHVERWVKRHRAVFSIATLALVVVVVGGTIAIRRVVRESAVNAALLRDSYFEQGRMHVLEGDKLGALTPLVLAYRMGATGEPTRLLIEEAARPTRARVLTLAGHTDKLWDVAFSPDGKWIATGSGDNTARIWDGETGALRATLPHTGWVTSVAFSPDSRLVASGGMDPIVYVWDVVARRYVAALPIAWGTRRGVVAFSPDGSVLLTASQKGVVNLWRMPEGLPVGQLSGHGTLVGAKFCDSGTCIVTCDSDRVVVWDPATLARRASYANKMGPINSFAVSHSGALLAFGTPSGEVVLLRGDGTPIARFAQNAGIYDLAISPDETLIAASSNDRTVRLWSAKGELRGVLAGHRASIFHVRFTPGGDRLVTTSADGTARLWTTSGMLLGELTGHTNLLTVAAVRSDGRRLATASWDHTVMVWDLARAEEYRPMITARDDRADSAPLLMFDSSAERIAVARADGTFSVVDARTGVALCTAAGSAPFRGLAWTGEQLAVARIDGHIVELWDAPRCVVETTLDHPAPISAMSMQSGPRLVTAAGDIVRVWNRGRLEASFTGYAGGIRSVGADGDDVYAITNAPTVAVVVDTMADTTRRRVFHGGTRTIPDVRFDHDRGLVLGAGQDQFLYVWDYATGVLVRKLQAGGPLYAVRTSPDGSMMIGVGGISLTIWDPITGMPIRQLDGHPDFVDDGEFLDDRLFVSIAGNGTAFVWDVIAARPLVAFHDVQAMALAADRSTVALVGTSGVRLWSPRAPLPDLDALGSLQLK